MAKYATIVNGAIYRIRDLTPEQVADIPPHKMSYVLPYIEVPRPVYDSATHHPPSRLPDAITATEVTQAWTTPVAKTTQELDDEKTSRATDLNNSDLGNALKLTMTAQFNQENRIRALESKAPITVDQYFDGIDALPTITDQEFIDRIKELMS